MSLNPGLTNSVAVDVLLNQEDGARVLNDMQMKLAKYFEGSLSPEVMHGRHEEAHQRTD